MILVHSLRNAAGIACLTVMLASGQALAVGSDSSEPPKPTKTTTECKRGEVWDEKKAKCVKADEKSGLDDDTIYKAARELAYANRYDEAHDLLMLARDRNDPRILNYLGYTSRKLGRYEVGMGYYREAIKRDPDYILARSYMGQALALAGDRKGAEEQLQQIAMRGGRDSWAYESLDNFLKTGRTTY